MQLRVGATTGVGEPSAWRPARTHPHDLPDNSARVLQWILRRVYSGAGTMRHFAFGRPSDGGAGPVANAALTALIAPRRLVRGQNFGAQSHPSCHGTNRGKVHLPAQSAWGTNRRPACDREGARPSSRPAAGPRLTRPPGRAVRLPARVTPAPLCCQPVVWSDFLAVDFLMVFGGCSVGCAGPGSG